jgi:hypothetical protein
MENKSKQDENIYFHNEILTMSIDNLKVNLITISSTKGRKKEREPMFEPRLFPSKIKRPFKFDTRIKKYVFITARVHPGESPGSYMFNGLLKFLLNG